MFENEPVGGRAEFAQTDLATKTACTPHIGASTAQASEAIAAAVVRIVETYAETGTPINAVNVRQHPAETGVLVVFHDNKVGVLAAVLKEIRNDGINIEEMENKIFLNGTAGCATIKVDPRPSIQLAEKLCSLDHICLLYTSPSPRDPH